MSYYKAKIKTHVMKKDNTFNIKYFISIIKVSFNNNT